MSNQRVCACIFFFSWPIGPVVWAETSITSLSAVQCLGSLSYCSERCRMRTLVCCQHLLLLLAEARIQLGEGRQLHCTKLHIVDSGKSTFFDVFSGCIIHVGRGDIWREDMDQKDLLLLSFEAIDQSTPSHPQWNELKGQRGGGKKIEAQKERCSKSQLQPLDGNGTVLSTMIGHASARAKWWGAADHVAGTDWGASQCVHCQVLHCEVARSDSSFVSRSCALTCFCLPDCESDCESAHATLS